MLGNPTAAPFTQFSETDLKQGCHKPSQAYSVRKRGAGHSVTPGRKAARPGVRSTVHKDNLAQ